MDLLRVGRFDGRQVVLDLDLVRLDVDDFQLGRQTVLDEQHLVQADRLAGVDLGPLRRVVAPDHFLLGRDLGDVLHAGKQDVAVGEHPHVVVFVALAGGIRPDDLAVVDQEHLVVALADV